MRLMLASANRRTHTFGQLRHLFVGYAEDAAIPGQGGELLILKRGPLNH
jgi:hypothetical protein